MSSSVSEIKKVLRQSIDSSPEKVSYFFKTGPGDYAEHDAFLGLTNPTLKRLAKQYSDLSFSSLDVFLSSSFNEERLFALMVLVCRFEKGDDGEKEEVVNFYLGHLSCVNNWNLVDCSAHYILGAYLKGKKRQHLIELAKSNNLWERRIAVVSTWAYIKEGDFSYTIKIVQMLFNDKHDLMHKACGWMLREVGKKDESVLLHFLDKHMCDMPRTMLRYAIERLADKERKYYLLNSK